MNQTIKNFMLFMITVLFTFNLNAQQEPKPLVLKYEPIQEVKWSMFSLYRAHVQDFGNTDKYNDTCNCLENGKFLDKANTNIGLSFYKNVDEKFAYSIDLMLGYGYTSRKAPSLEEKERSWLSTARADLYYNLTSNKLQLQPYVVGGLHASQRSGTMLATMPVGMGARYMFFNNQAMITMQVGYGLGLTNRIRNSVIYSSGLYVNLNKKNKAKNIDSETLKHTGSSCVSCGAVVDTDCDGIVDAIDKCPMVPGLPSNNGCPVSDRDGDGVVDQQDKCPDVPGAVNNEGCPITPIDDRDKDGIADNVDGCPDVAGPISNQGCPITVSADRDGDGILDKFDKCPDVPGALNNYGCPLQVLQKEIPNGRNYIGGDTIQYIIYFDFDKYNLKQNSYDILNDVIDFLKRNDTYKVKLVGHTDLEGKDEYNINLSQNRVSTAKKYLMSYGIESFRITNTFYGKMQPAIPSFDKDLAWKNRRVEIFLTK
jgi:outer membrane protein OmpA-like peptidoglycan-associated protein